MAIYFTFDNNVTREYHIGTTFLITCEDVVTSVQADGHELERIRGFMTNLPMHHGRVVSWHGDFAQFIAHNWNKINK